MAHPFEKMFAAALMKSTKDDNLVLETALKLSAKGYSNVEIAGVLKSYAQGLIYPTEALLITESYEEFVEQLGLITEE